MRIRVHAAHVLPIATAPIARGWVDVQRGTVQRVGARTDPGGAVDAEVDLGAVVIMPGLVNAHVHFELSHLRGCVAPADSFITWVTHVLRARREQPSAGDDVIATAIDEAHRTGTVAFGDVGNTDAAVAPLRASGLDAWHFRELIGFRSGSGAGRAEAAWDDAERANRAVDGGKVRHGVAPHAPYSTAPDLVRAIVDGLRDEPARRSSIHLAEAPEELQLLRDGTGPWRALLEAFDTWDPAWEIPRSGPAAYLEGIGALHRHLLVVHGTQGTPDDLERLARAGSPLVVCARSNAWVGAGVPPVAEALHAGVRLAIGTDSLASVPDLDMFGEIAAVRRIAPTVAPAVLLHAATRGGADALGFEHLGTLAPGKSARLLVVALPPHVDDVEEWLTAGEVAAADLRWLRACLDEVGSGEGVFA